MKYKTKKEVQIELMAKNRQIMYLRNHLKQMRDKIDYLLKHPYCQSYGTRRRK